MMETVFLIIEIITVCWYFIVIFLLFRGLFTHTRAGASNGNTFSIIIAARNEASNIEACLETILVQSIDQNRFEVIVVNDRSTDETPNIVKKMQHRFSTLKLITIDETPEGISPKKYAIAQGVTIAQHGIIVFTDADCRVQPGWLEILDRHFTPDVGLVQGITTYFFIPGMNRLFYGLQALDFISHGIVAAAAIGAGLPINSNANNFAFRKKAFIETGGVLSGIGHVVSGDDDLLLQKIWKLKKWNIKFMFEKAAVVATQPSPSIGAVFQQRARWGSKTVHYNKVQVILLSGIFFFYVNIIILMLGIPFNSFFCHSAIILFCCKFFGECFLMIPGLIKFKRLKLLPLLPIASMVQLPLVLGAVVIGIFGKFSWKGQAFSRTIK
jgi:cellulose synthase/poly-beta-1,6-N-acetylglucosamine synthase-like glycosyltransferase